MPKGVRKSITIPGLLAPAVKRRSGEFGHSIFAPYAVELVCYDLRSDAKHEITVAIARDTQAAQDAVDRELVSRYRPGQPREGLLVQLAERIHHLGTSRLEAGTIYRFSSAQFQSVSHSRSISGGWSMCGGRRSNIPPSPPTSPD